MWSIRVKGAVQRTPGSRRRSPNLISRVADHCFWFGRYLERAESTARVLTVTSSLALDNELPVAQVWPPVIIVSGEQPSFAARFGDNAAEDGDVTQNYMTWDAE